jgi:hypothetical protein
MVLMKRLIIICFFFLFSTLVKAEVQVQVEPRQINIDDSFRLILIQDNLANGSIPDLTSLKKDFIILGTERRMNYSIINGKTQSSSEWTVVLKAVKAGKLIIPAIKMGKEYTQPISIEVEQTSLSSAEADKDYVDENQNLYLRVAVDKNKPYVNQQIIYKVTLYYAKRLLDAEYQGPQAENALITPLGEQKRYQTQKNGQTYYVEEQNYAIFPQKSGNLKIKSPVFTGLVYDFNPERIKAQDKTLNVEVQPIPKDYSGKVWLPAKKIKLMEHYENAEQTLSQGSTLIRTVTLEAIGTPVQLLPPIHFDKIKGVQVYPEKLKDKNRLTFGELIGRVQFNVTYLFNQAGNVNIPELKLPWFNTETGKEEIATLPARTFTVSSANVVSQTKKSPVDVALPKTSPSIKESNNIASESTFNWAWVLAILFGLAWVITLILWSCQKQKTNGKGQYKAALNNLQKACLQSNPQRARDALLIWGRLYWPDAQILNLTDLFNQSSNATFKKQVDILSQVLYENKNKKFWQGEELWKIVQRMKKTSNKQADKVVLPPTNPSQ